MSVVLPTYLIDDYEDGMISERAWVQVTEITDTAIKAVEWLDGEMAAEDQQPGSRYIVTGKEHQRPVGTLVEGREDLRSVKPLDEYADCKECVDGKWQGIDEIQGADPIKFEELSATEKRKLGKGHDWNAEAQAIVEKIGGTAKLFEDDCDECYGTGKAGEFLFESYEPLPWEKCEEDAPEAMLFWAIELTEDENAPLTPEVNEHQQGFDL
jgi:hypothetical protein